VNGPVSGSQGELFDAAPSGAGIGGVAGAGASRAAGTRRKAGTPRATEPGVENGGTIVRVVPDVRGVRNEFDYLVPDALGVPEVGTLVDVDLGY
jgi:hypothetical protein